MHYLYTTKKKEKIDVVAVSVDSVDRYITKKKEIVDVTVSVDSVDRCTAYVLLKEK
jgi:hypothetical protein